MLNSSPAFLSLCAAGSQAVNDEIGRQILTLGRRVPASEINQQIDVRSLDLCFCPRTSPNTGSTVLTHVHLTAVFVLGLLSPFLSCVFCFAFSFCCFGLLAGQAVSASSVRDALKKYVYDRCPAVAAIGPVEQLPDYNRLRSNLVWLRT